MIKPATDSDRRYSGILPPKRSKISLPKKRMQFHQFFWLILILVGAVTCSACVVALSGKDLPPSMPQSIDGVGTIEDIRLPENARKLRDIHKFVIGGGGGDDFGRIYLNNYVINSGESPDFLFYTSRGDSKDAREKITQYAINRNMKMVGDRDVFMYLRKGDNYIVQELENSIWASCGAFISLEVNGTLLEHFPQQIPENSYVEKSVSKQDLADKFNKSEVGALSNALCARRIFHFFVE